MKRKERRFANCFEKREREGERGERNLDCSTKSRRRRRRSIIPAR